MIRFVSSSFCRILLRSTNFVGDVFMMMLKLKKISIGVVLHNFGDLLQNNGKTVLTSFYAVFVFYQNWGSSGYESES